MRGRGRPRKTENQTITPPSNSVPLEQPKRLKPTLKSLFKFSGQIAAKTTKFQEFEIDDIESELLAEQADNVVYDFYPNVQSKWANLIIFLVSLLSTFGTRWAKYADQKAKEEKLKKENEQSKTVNIKPTFMGQNS